MHEIKHKSSQELLAIGWREWVVLPDLKVKKIKAKIDTGARTSALHAFDIEVVKKHGREQVKFYVHPLQRNEKKVVECRADLVDIRWISDSSGNRERRYVIQTPLHMGEREWDIEVTLTNRASMTYRMLLGRSALAHHCHINPATSYLLKKPKR